MKIMKYMKNIQKNIKSQKLKMNWKQIIAPIKNWNMLILMGKLDIN